MTEVERYAYEIQYDSKDELTSVTANNLPERAQSVIEDDVESLKSNREYQASYIGDSKMIKATVPNQVYDATNLTDTGYISQYSNRYSNDIDEYDLEKLDRYSNWDQSNAANNSATSDDDDVRTVVPLDNPAVLITRHETSGCNMFSSMKETIPDNNDGSESSADIGQQIGQLARRIESLGNISRIYETGDCQLNGYCSDVHCNQILPSCQHHGHHHGHIHHHHLDQHHHNQHHLDQHNHDQHHLDQHHLDQHHHDQHHHDQHKQSQQTLKTARKIDNLERLQKRQETMQSRLLTLARKLNDSNKDLTQLPEPVPTRVLESPKKRTGKKKKTKEVSKAKKQTASFLGHVLDEIDVARSPQEPPLISSTYYIPPHEARSTTSNSNNGKDHQFFVEEITNIRREFRTQVDEIRHLLSERYQREDDASKRNTEATKAENERLVRDLESLKRASSPLRLVTNVCEEKACPLDKYLEKSIHCSGLAELDHEGSGTTLRAGNLPSVARAIRSKHRMLSDPIEAERFLIELTNRRANLENNIQALERSKDSELLFEILRKLQGNENTVENARIQALIDDAIAISSPEIQAIVSQTEWYRHPWEDYMVAEKLRERWLNAQVQREHQLWLERMRREREQREREQSEDQETRLQKQQQQQQQQQPRVSKQHTATGVGLMLSKYSVSTRQPGVCKKYGSVSAKTDSGLKKRPRSMVSATSTVPPQTTALLPEAGGTHTTWANRRRYRRPYLHFVNEVKLAKRPIASLGDLGAEPKTYKDSHHKMARETSSEKTIYHRYSNDPDAIIPMGVKQYSLDYNEVMVDEKENDIVDAGISTEDPPHSMSARQNVSQEPPVNENTPKNDGPTQKIKFVSEHVVPPSSPTFSETGTGFRLGGRTPRSTPFIPTDPLHDRLPSRVDTVPRQRPQAELDIGNLRWMIERALLAEIPSPSKSVDLSESSHTLSRREMIPTPLPTEYEERSETFQRTDHDDRTLSLVHSLRTPEVSEALSGRHSRVSTPSRIDIVSPRRPDRNEQRPVSTQTAAAQPMRDQDAQTAVPTPRAISPRSPLARSRDQSASLGVTADLSASSLSPASSITDTVPRSFSDGLWLLDRSEGQVADWPIEPITRWRIGECPDQPAWPQGTAQLTEADVDSDVSFGEFRKPTLPGLTPTKDAVLQVMQLPAGYHRRGDFDSDSDSDLKPLGQRRHPLDGDAVVASSRERLSSAGSWSQARSAGAPRHSNNHHPHPHVTQPRETKDSEGEVSVDEEQPSSSQSLLIQAPVSHNETSVISPLPRGHAAPRSVGSASHPSEVDDKLYDPAATMTLMTSNEGPPRKVQRDLRASRQSQSSLSESAGLMSTGQIIKGAFMGDDSHDFDHTAAATDHRPNIPATSNNLDPDDKSNSYSPDNYEDENFDDANDL